MERVFHDSRASICPECHQVLPADYVSDDAGVHLEKFCPQHGAFVTRVARSHQWLSSLQEYAADTPGPGSGQTPVAHGCPADCGECAGHRQKAAFFLFEVTNACDLDCPICLGEPRAPGDFVSVADMEAMVSSVCAHGGTDACATLGGGEPTLHPRFFDLVAVLKRAGMHDIWLYTNGRRIARDPGFATRLAEANLYVVLQWDGFCDEIYRVLRGAPLLEEKQRAIDTLRASGARLGLCPTVVAGLNQDQLGNLYAMFAQDGQIGTLDIATMAFVGRGRDFPHGREGRATSQDMLIALEEQTRREIRASDFSPVSLSHPECLQIAYLLAVPGGGVIPLKRFLDPTDYRVMIRNSALFQLNAHTTDLLHDAVNRLWASGKRDPDTRRGLEAVRSLIDALFPGAGGISDAERKAKARDQVKVILVHSYMDGLNFDIGRARKCISRTVMPNGRLMPTCAYNVVHRPRGAGWICPESPRHRDP